MAFASLSPPVQRLAEELTGLHDGSQEFGYYLAQRRGGQGSEWDGEIVTALDTVAHPVVRVHPETGRKSLFVNPGFTVRIAGVSDAESRYLLDLFFAHLTRPEHIVRHRWAPGACTGSPCAETRRWVCRRQHSEAGRKPVIRDQRP